MRVTNLGAMLLAMDLNSSQALRRKTLRVISYDGKGKVATNREQTVGEGYAASFQRMIDLIEFQTPVREVIERALRRDVRAYPVIAIRELLANALIHQDFEVSGASVMVEIYIDRIEISNPGVPGVQLERFIDGYRCRNESLADLMRRFGICEEKGSGIDKVVQAVEEHHLPAPEFRVDAVRTTCVLHGPREFAGMSRADRVRACYQHCCLRYVSNEPMTNQSLRERFRLAETSLRMHRMSLPVRKPPDSSSWTAQRPRQKGMRATYPSGHRFISKQTRFRTSLVDKAMMFLLFFISKQTEFSVESAAC